METPSDRPVIRILRICYEFALLHEPHRTIEELQLYLSVKPEEKC